MSSIIPENILNKGRQKERRRSSALSLALGEDDLPKIRDVQITELEAHNLNIQNKWQKYIDICKTLNANA